MISQGDWIILWNPDSAELLNVSGETKRVPGLGIVDTKRFVGMPYGSSIDLGRQSYHVLRPSLRQAPEFMRRGPQIIQPIMTSVIIHKCDIKSGDRIVEGGAGSGMLTAALLRAVGDRGRVYTYEKVEEHLEVARFNVETLGFGASWVPRVGDVTGDLEERDMDAFVVDIPQPWDALETAGRVLRGGGAFLAYVPTTNQVERTHNAMRALGFQDLECSEIIERTMVVNDGGIRPSFKGLGHNGYIIRGTKTVGNPA